MIKRRISFIYLGLTLLFSACTSNSEENIQAKTPPLGWNSFDSYGVYLHEEAAMANLEAFAEKLKPHGYEYFVIDAGWFGEFELQPGTIYPAEKHARKMNFNGNGLLQPSETYFPNGFQPIIARCHDLGIKFGLHLMRGIPREAVKQNLPIQGTQYRAADIADTTSICSWNHQNYGIDMSKPGAQEFYNSLISQMADWGVDFIKYDDLVPFPEEIKAIAKAIESCGRPIVYSLSPGGSVDPEHIDAFKKAHMLRVTKDIWDEQKGIDQCFSAWRKWQGKEAQGFWIDMDMIPFGQLQLMNQKPEGLNGKSGELGNIELLAGKGFNRWSQFTNDQMFTFITMRALAASPLMMGGDLPSLDVFSLDLITHPEVLACNQNGIMGSLIYQNGTLEVWKTPKNNGSKEGWIGLFNRNSEPVQTMCSEEILGIDPAAYNIISIWNDAKVPENQALTIPANGVIFIKYWS